MMADTVPAFLRRDDRDTRPCAACSLHIDRRELVRYGYVSLCLDCVAGVERLARRVLVAVTT